jgi:heterodisulfide reductase subunit A
MTDSILIVGGGVAGLHAAQECAAAGARAVVIERGPVIGGRLAATMTAGAELGDRAEGVGTPAFDALADNENIEIITLANLEGIEGRPGNFTVSIRARARFVTDACTRCKLCHTACPVVLPNEYDAGLTFRKAIYTPMAETLPGEYVIDIANCLNTPPNYLPCQRCVEVCEDDAIHFDRPFDTVHERQVGAVILAPGFRVGDSAGFDELGYGEHPDIVTSAELQRLLEWPGPTGGYASKPSDEEYPDSVLLVVDEPSHFGLYIVASQAHQLVQQDVGKVTVLLLSQPQPGGESGQAGALASESGVQVAWGGMLKLDPADGNVIDASYQDFSANRYVHDTYDMVVLCSDVAPAEGLAELAQLVGVELSDSGYVAIGAGDGGNGVGVATSRPGLFVAGCASGPKNIKDSIAAAHAAAVAALDHLDPRLLRADYVPPQPEEAPAPDGSEDEVRARIEQILYALLGSDPKP